MGKYFGTDGVRGRAGEGKLTPSRLTELGLAVGEVLTDKTDTPVMIIGRDTRESGDMLFEAFTNGLVQKGVQILDAGIVPTPAVSMLTASTGTAVMGAMITASHNPYHDNGLKLFSADGFKISDKDQHAIEVALDMVDSSDITNTGSILPLADGAERYVEALTQTWPEEIENRNAQIVVDCANGAAFETAQMLFAQLGFENITFIGTQPNGTNINKGVGSTHPEKLIETVKTRKADLGIAFDGDADRLLLCDENGAIIDGDQIIGVLARQAYETGRLKGGAVIATVMSNLGLERYVNSLDLNFIRTAVGDRHVAAHMRRFGQNIGGEQSGHILILDICPAGDGSLAALHVLAALLKSGQKASKFLHVFKPVPQILKNVRYSGDSPVGTAGLDSAILKAKARLGDGGRILIRASGTEPVIRVMAEGDNKDTVTDIVNDLADTVKQLTQDS